MNIDKSDKSSFWRKVEIPHGGFGCWEWSAYVRPNGYGRFRGHYAHRVSWIVAHGKIPEGLLVCHHCDNRSCVNPSHLFVGTQADNLKDASQKGRLNESIAKATSSSLETRRKLTEDDVVEIKRMLQKDDIFQKEIAERFGVTRSAITAINTGKNWGHVEI